MGLWDCAGRWFKYPWDEEIATWLSTIGSRNASSVSKVCLHLGDYSSRSDPDDFLDAAYDVCPSKFQARAWPCDFSPSLSFEVRFLSLESPSGPDHRWNLSSFELPLYDKAAARHQINRIFDEKSVGLKALLKQAEEGDAGRGKGTLGPESQDCNQDNSPGEEMTVQRVRAEIEDVADWRGSLEALVAYNFVDLNGESLTSQK